MGSAGSLGLPFESATSLLGFLSSHCSHTVTVQKAKVKSQGSFAWPTVNRFTPSLEAGTYLPQDLPELCEKALRKWEPFTWEMLSTELVAADPNADYSAPFAGEQIVFQGLSEDGASLNGCNGTCLFLHKDIGRYVVRVLSGLREGEHVHVKPANLVVPLGDGSGGDAREADSGEGGAEAQGEGGGAPDQSGAHEESHRHSTAAPGGGSKPDDYREGCDCPRCSPWHAGGEVRWAEGLRDTSDREQATGEYESKKVECEFIIVIATCVLTKCRLLVVKYLPRDTDCSPFSRDNLPILEGNGSWAAGKLRDWIRGVEQLIEECRSDRETELTKKVKLLELYQNWTEQNVQQLLSMNLSGMKSEWVQSLLWTVCPQRCVGGGRTTCDGGQWFESEYCLRNVCGHTFCKGCVVQWIEGLEQGWCDEEGVDIGSEEAARVIHRGIAKAKADGLLACTTCYHPLEMVYELPSAGDSSGGAAVVKEATVNWRSGGMEHSKVVRIEKWDIENIPKDASMLLIANRSARHMHGLPSPPAHPVVF